MVERVGRAPAGADGESDEIRARQSGVQVRRRLDAESRAQLVGGDSFAAGLQKHAMREAAANMQLIVERRLASRPSLKTLKRTEAERFEPVRTARGR